MATGSVRSIQLTETGAVKASAGWIWGIVVNGTGTCTLADGEGGTDLLGAASTVILERPIYASTGIYATITATPTAVYVLYD